MAANLSNDDERERRILLVGNYFLENPTASTRSAAKYFSENFFKISNYTIHDYLQRYKKMIVSQNKEIFNSINKIMEDNKPDNINNEEVRKRVLLNSKLFLYNNMTIEEISNATGVSFWTIYRDLNQRLAVIDSNLHNKVNDMMIKRSLENLNKNIGK